jgi:hypothetical protein
MEGGGGTVIWRREKGTRGQRVKRAGELAWSTRERSDAPTEDVLFVEDGRS